MIKRANKVRPKVIKSDKKVMNVIGEILSYLIIKKRKRYFLSSLVEKGEDKNKKIR